MKVQPVVSKLLISFAVLAVGCGGGSAGGNSSVGDPTNSTSTQTSGSSTQVVAVRDPNACPEPSSSGGLSIEGQLGTIRQGQVSATLNPAVNQLQQCYTRRLEELPYLAGAVSYKIRIGTDGAVRWVLPTADTIGDHSTSECMKQILAGLHFPRPCGGETETTWGPITFEGGEDARPAVAWEVSRIQRQIDRRRPQLTQCLHGAHGAQADVTTYIAPGGRVATASASVNHHEAAEAVQCLVQEVSTWQVADPGSYAARVTFRVQ